jgi:hypothetical protein
MDALFYGEDNTVRGLDSDCCRAELPASQRQNQDSGE